MHVDQLTALADRHGLLVRRTIDRGELSRKAWRHAHDRGLLVAVHREVSRLVTAAPTPTLLVAAAVHAASAAAGEGRAMASGRTAALLLGADVPHGGPIHVTVTGRAALAPIDGVRLHRPRNHLDLVALTSDGVAHTRPGRTLLDVAAWDPRLVGSVLEQFIVRRWITPDDAGSIVRRHSRRGRPGLVALRAAVEAWTLRQRPPDSVLEARFARLAHEHELPPFEFQRPVGRFRTDFCRVPERLIVECDGFADHGRRLQRIEEDNARDAELAADGWLVLRFTWTQINGRSAWVAGRIRSVLRVRQTGR